MINCLKKTCIILGCLIMMWGCSRKTTITTTPEPIAQGELKVAELIANDDQIQTLQAKMAIRILQGAPKVSSSSEISIVRDQHLLISVKPFLGIEVFRAHFTPNQICVIDRLKKRYLLLDISALNAILPVDMAFHSLQSLFLNELFTLKSESFQLTDYRLFNWADLANGDTQGVYKSKSMFLLEFLINSATQLSHTKVGMASQSAQLDWTYRSFSTTEPVGFPTESTVKVQLEEKTYAADLDFNRIVINKPLDLTIEVPQHYTRVNIKEIINALIHN